MNTPQLECCKAKNLSVPNEVRKCVLQNVFWILKRGGLITKLNMSPEETLAILLAAAIHDYEHPGFDNSFVKNNKIISQACSYPDSELERHSIACGLNLIESTNVLTGLPDRSLNT